MMSHQHQKIEGCRSDNLSGGGGGGGGGGDGASSLYFCIMIDNIMYLYGLGLSGGGASLFIIVIQTCS